MSMLVSTAFYQLNRRRTKVKSLQVVAAGRSVVVCKCVCVFPHAKYTV